MRRLTATRTALAVMGVTLVAASCSSGSDRAEVAPGWERQAVEIGDLEVAATPMRIDKDGMEFRIVLDAHTVTLDTDIAAAARLLAGDDDMGRGTWDGDGPGGHHREGVLRFAGSADRSGPVELRIGGFDEPAVFRWVAAPQG